MSSRLVLNGTVEMVEEKQQQQQEEAELESPQLVSPQEEVSKAEFVQLFKRYRNLRQKFLQNSSFCHHRTAGDEESPDSSPSAPPSFKRVKVLEVSWIKENNLVLFQQRLPSAPRVSTLSELIFGSVKLNLLNQSADQIKIHENLAPNGVHMTSLIFSESNIQKRIQQTALCLIWRLERVADAPPCIGGPSPDGGASGRQEEKSIQIIRERLLHQNIIQGLSALKSRFVISCVVSCLEDRKREFLLKLHYGHFRRRLENSLLVWNQEEEEGQEGEGALCQELLIG